MVRIVSDRLLSSPPRHRFETAAAQDGYFTTRQVTVRKYSSPEGYESRFSMMCTLRPKRSFVSVTASVNPCRS